LLPPTILAAKIKTFVRNGQPDAPAGVIRLGTLTIDLDRYAVSRSGEPIALTPIEFRLLRVLAENAGKVCSHQMLLDRVWGEDFLDCSHYLRLYVGYLRHKLEEPQAAKDRDDRMGIRIPPGGAHCRRLAARRPAFRTAASG
jgi:two-component system KDP operon response regulator KdpE